VIPTTSPSARCAAPTKLTTRDAAYLNRLQVITDLKRCGYEVFESTSLLSCLAVNVGGRLAKIQVAKPAARKTVELREGYHALAVILQDGSIEYRPPLQSLNS